MATTYPSCVTTSIEQLVDGEPHSFVGGGRVQMPPAHGTFRKAERVKKVEGKQNELGI
jgi:hypothetical protein